MSSQSFSGPPPLVVGVLPGQHPEVLRSATGLAEKLGVPLLCAYVDEASFLVEWDPARSAHRLSLHPDKEDSEVRAVSEELRRTVEAACEGKSVTWDLRILTGDPARALGRFAAEANAAMIIVGTPERGLGHRVSVALSGSVASWLSHHQDHPILVVPPRMGAHRDEPA